MLYKKTECTANHKLHLCRRNEGSVSFGQSGYIGQSMSVRAKKAYDGGEMPKSKWTKQAIMDALCDEFGDAPASGFSKFSKDTLFQNCLKRSSWHHTGKFANATDFFSIDREAAMAFADSQDIQSMRQTILDDISLKQAKAKKDAEDAEKSAKAFKDRKEKHASDLSAFMDGINKSLTEPKELQDGKWEVTYESPDGGTVHRKFAGQSYAQAFYDRIKLGKNDPAKNSDDFWDRAFYASTSW